MAHLVETMAYAGDVPWHGLGIPVRSDLTPDQMLKKAGLDWEVAKVQPYYPWKQGVKPLSKQALIRLSDGMELSVVSEDWTPNQNKTAFEFFHEFVMEGDMSMNTAGSLMNGRMVWALAKINDGFTIAGKDRVDSYLLFSNPHMYGKSIDVRFTPIRVVCHNTLTLSLAGKSDLGIKISHRNAFNKDFVKRTLGIAKRELNTYQSMAEFMAGKKYTKDNVVEYFKRVFPTTSSKPMSDNAARAFKMTEAQPGAEFAAGSWWQPFNAVTYMIDHHIGRTQETRLYNSWYGTMRDKKRIALDMAVEYAETSGDLEHA